MTLTEPLPPYPELYVEGLRLFNEEDFFECHDVLEELWSDTQGPERKFYQGLIQLSISLFHFGNDNFGGARKLYESSRKYLESFRPAYMNVDLDKLLAEHQSCFAELNACPDPFKTPGLVLRDELVPKVTFLSGAE
ncbi:MAG: hypothetical protein JWM11_7621 [Planctomycetaceae bacterium]|nr:hypothetical protein [Planctomycetaceae bacterium]